MQVELVIPARAAGPATAPPVARPVAPGPRASAEAEEVRRQLEALEAARAAGILSDVEYAAKKAELTKKLAETSGGGPDPETQAKLAALEQARAAGILSEEEYARKKAELAGPGSAPAPEGPLPAPAKGKTYRHPVGFGFWYPEAWRVETHPEFLQLVPPDAAGGAGGGEEFYLVSGEPVGEEGVTKSSDPRVVAYLDEQVRSMAPMLRRTAGPTPVATVQGGGVVLDWEGRNPDGETVLARAFVNIIDGNGVYLVALGLKRHVERRNETLRSIFVSFGFGKGRIDRALAGRWSLVSTADIANESPFVESWERARAVSERRYTLTLREDGTWEQVEDYHAIIMGSGVSLEDRQRNVTKGKWFAGDGILCLVGDDLAWTEHRYRLEGNRLRLASGGRGQIWER